MLKYPSCSGHRKVISIPFLRGSGSGPGACIYYCATGRFRISIKLRRYHFFHIRHNVHHYRSANVNPPFFLTESGRPPQRPPLPSRNSSFQKRHASFDSPREIPLPSPSLHHSYCFQFPDSDSHPSCSPLGSGVNPLASGTPTKEYPVFEHGTDDSDSTSLPSAPSTRPTSPSQSPCRNSDPSLKNGTIRAMAHMTSPQDKTTYTEPAGGSQHPRDQGHGQEPAQPNPLLQLQPGQSQGPSPVFPFSRPYSLPETHTQSYGPAIIHSPSPTRPAWPAQSSSVSLPLPMQTPYFSLPKVAPADEAQQKKHGGSTGERHPLAPSESKGFDPTTAASTHRSPPRPPPDSSAAPSTSPPRHVHSPEPESSYHGANMRSAPSMFPRPMSSGASSSHSYPPPAPPTILTPPPVEFEANPRTQAPYEPFLSHAPPPEDSWIAVETSQTEYKLIVRLPGFRRDGM